MEATNAPKPFRTVNVTFFGEEMSETFSKFPARIGNRVVLRGISFHRANRPEAVACAVFNQPHKMKAWTCEDVD